MRAIRSDACFAPTPVQSLCDTRLPPLTHRAGSKSASSIEWRVRVGDVDELHRLMTEERVGKPVPITVLRLSQKLEIVVTPRKSPPRPAT